MTLLDRQLQWVEKEGTARLAIVPRRPTLAPDMVAIPRAWFDANELTGLSDDDPVASWPDLSGHGNDAAHATGSKKPTYKTGVANGLPAVWFDGTDDSMGIPHDASLDFGSRDFTLVIVFIRETDVITNARLISKGAINDTASDPDNYGWGIDGSDGQIVFRIGHGEAAGAPARTCPA